MYVETVDHGNQPEQYAVYAVSFADQARCGLDKYESCTTVDDWMVSDMGDARGVHPHMDKTLSYPRCCLYENT